jgi:hypothetical protein
MGLPNLMFLETPQTHFGDIHAKVLKHLLTWGEQEQKRFIKSLETNKTTLSEAIGDLQSLRWVRVQDSNFGNVIKLNNYKKKEIDLFLSYWYSLSKLILVRPNDIILQGLIYSEGEGREKLVQSLSREEGFKYTPSGMNNNTKHTFYTPYGRIAFHTKGASFTFYVEGFVLPLEYSDIKHLTEYIEKGISDRFLNLLNVLKAHLDKTRVTIKETFRLKELDIGLIAKKDIHKVVLMERMLKENNMYSDESVYGVDELETEGDLETCVANITNFLNDCVLHEINLREGIDTSTNPEDKEIGIPLNTLDENTNIENTAELNKELPTDYNKEVLYNGDCCI